MDAAGRPVRGACAAEAAAPLPPVAAWRHHGVRDGFEVAFLSAGPDGVRLEGYVAAVEDGRAFAVGYEIELDGRWRTRRAWVWSHTDAGSRTTELARDRDGWTVDGAEAPGLEGCADVDLEASALTNTLPVRRLGLAAGAAADAPAAWVRAVDLRTERLDQRYARLDDSPGRCRYAYAAPALGVRAELVVDAAGLVVTYPGLAERHPR
jgi:hypothetical protein